jgi:nucleoside-diphosphate-sugar epimerase
MSRVLVTGANGFVGSILCPMLAQSGYAVRAATRADRPGPDGARERVVVGDIDGSTAWTAAVSGVDMVIHLAARAHALNDGIEDSRLCLQTNAYGTRRLAEEAARHGIRRFVYLSSVKVNGEETTQRAYSVDDVPHPLDAYGSSKWQAEQFLARTAASTGMQAVVVRSPLVYGPGVRANFRRLLRWVERERWLPLGAIRNQRSLVSVWNLCDLLIRLLEHPAAAGRAWMVSDGQDVSTPELVRRIARAMGRRARLIALPAPLLHLGAGLLGRQAQLRRLCGSLTVDIAPTVEQLGWSPPLSMDESLARTVGWYLSAGGRTA